MIVAVLGTGTMGAPMARNLVEAGLDVRVWNRTIEKAREVEGAEVRETPAEAAAGVDIVLTMLTDGEAVEETVADVDFGEAVWLQMSTVGINATVAKVASGAAETMPYFMVTNLARTLNELKEREIRVIGTSDDAQKSLYQLDLSGPVALVLGAEGSGMRQLTSRTCDELVRLPMKGAVESLNVSVASGICLYEALRQRGG